MLQDQWLTPMGCLTRLLNFFRLRYVFANDLYQQINIEGLSDIIIESIVLVIPIYVVVTTQRYNGQSGKALFNLTTNLDGF
jgi:hypothetical protein